MPRYSDSEIREVPPGTVDPRIQSADIVVSNDLDYLYRYRGEYLLGYYTGGIRFRTLHPATPRIEPEWNQLELDLLNNLRVVFPQLSSGATSALPEVFGGASPLPSIFTHLPTYVPYIDLLRRALNLVFTRWGITVLPSLGVTPQEIAISAPSTLQTFVSDPSFGPLLVRAHTFLTLVGLNEAGFLRQLMYTILWDDRLIVPETTNELWRQALQ